MRDRVRLSFAERAAQLPGLFRSDFPRRTRPRIFIVSDRNSVIAAAGIGLYDLVKRDHCLHLYALLFCGSTITVSIPYVPTKRARDRAPIQQHAAMLVIRLRSSVYHGTPRLRHYRILANGRVMCTEAT